MTRIGINPARGKVTDRLPAPVTAAMVTYLPNLAGYFEQRLEVLKLVAVQPERSHYARSRAVRVR